LPGKNKECVGNLHPGLMNSLQRMTIDDSKLNELARQLRRIEKNYLSSELTPTQKAKPGNSTFIFS